MNDQIFDAAAQSYLQESASRIIPPELIGQRGVGVVIQLMTPEKVGFRWLAYEELMRLLNGQDDPMQHHLKGLLEAVLKTDFRYDICMAVLSPDFKLCSIAMLEHTRRSRRGEPKGFGRTLPKPKA